MLSSSEMAVASHERMRPWWKCLTAVSAAHFGRIRSKEVERLAKENRFDYILIESTGVGEPIPVSAQTFTYMDEEQNIDLTAFCRLDTMVTVVDAINSGMIMPQVKHFLAQPSGWRG